MWLVKDSWFSSFFSIKMFWKWVKHKIKLIDNKDPIIEKEKGILNGTTKIVNVPKKKPTEIIIQIKFASIWLSLWRENQNTKVIKDEKKQEAL